MNLRHKKPSDDEDDLLVEETKKPSKKNTKKSSAKKLTGYTYFCHENRSDVKDDNPEMSAAEITKQLDKLWKELSEGEKQEWRDNAQNK